MPSFQPPLQLLLKEEHVMRLPALVSLILTIATVSADCHSAERPRANITPEHVLGDPEILADELGNPRHNDPNFRYAFVR